MTLADILLCAGMLSVASCHHFMLPAVATNYVFTFLITAHGAPKESLYGWCKKNKCPNKAQSGDGDYCKTCFRVKFPKEHKEKMQSRKKECEICHASSELRQGFCKPCWTARGCSHSGCKWINKDMCAPQCSQCNLNPSLTTAKHVRLAMCCPFHSTDEQKKPSLCSICFSKILTNKRM